MLEFALHKYCQIMKSLRDNADMAEDDRIISKIKMENYYYKI